MKPCNTYLMSCTCDYCKMPDVDCVWCNYKGIVYKDNHNYDCNYDYDYNNNNGVDSDYDDYQDYDDDYDYVCDICSEGYVNTGKIRPFKYEIGHYPETDAYPVDKERVLLMYYLNKDTAYKTLSREEKKTYANELLERIKTALQNNEPWDNVCLWR